jgi:hypothetical protein
MTTSRGASGDVAPVPPRLQPLIETRAQPRPTGPVHQEGEHEPTASVVTLPLANVEREGPISGTRGSWATLAGVLQARLLNVRAARLGSFELFRDDITLRKLSHLTRPHTGVRGQAFEIAVAEAINAGDAEVADLVQQGLRHVNLRADAVRAHLFGAERLGDERLAGHLRSVLDPAAHLRTGDRGRPFRLGGILDTLAEEGFRAGVPARLEKLPKADLFLEPVGGRGAVAASLKVNPNAIAAAGWPGVPLWITASRGGIRQGCTGGPRHIYELTLCCRSTGPLCQRLTLRSRRLILCFSGSTPSGPTRVSPIV